VKKRTHLPTESFEKQSYKRSYIQRKYNELDAEKEIKEYKHDETGSDRTTDKRQEMQNTPRLD